MAEAPGARHFYDGRRVVSLRGDSESCAAISAAVSRLENGPAAGPAGESSELNGELGSLLLRLGIAA